MTDQYKDEITVIIPNNLMSLNRLHHVCESIVWDLPFAEKRRYFLMVALSEAYTNAFEHGNQKNPESEIKLTFYVSEKYLKIVIEDEGILPIQDTEVNISSQSDPEDTGGRGLVLINKIFDEAVFENSKDGTNRVTLISNFDSVNNEVFAIKER